MLHTKFRGNLPAGSGEEDFWRVFTMTSRQELPSRGKFNIIFYINTCKILIY